MMLIYSIICKYVFFESGLEAEKQRVYYVALLLFCVIFMFVFDDTVAGYTMDGVPGRAERRPCQKKHKLSVDVR